MTEVLALIPARGGSKGIPRKNIRPFCGYPLIAYSIAAGLQAQTVTRVIVSTDDEEIAAVARAWGAETPFLRPAEFAQDQTTDLPVFQHALSWLAEREAYRPDVVVQLRPTSPIRPVGLVDDAVRTLLRHADADSVRGIVPAGQNPHKMWRLPGGLDSPMKNLLDVEGIEEPYNAPRQILPEVYWQTGHIDAIRPGVIWRGSMSGRNIYPLLIDPNYTVDLDNLRDWARAEWLALNGGLKMVWPGRAKRPMPEKIELLVLDFDGVVTDNRVWVDEQGREMVAAYRSDSLIISRLRRAGTEVVILSSEVNPVVAARARKMNVEAIHGIGLDEKAKVLKNLLESRKIEPSRVAYIGNDLNDLPCFEQVGWAVAVADALPEVLRAADYVTTRPGGHGAVREVCDLILKEKPQS
ncbi:MAG: acylneuraminate cytidylyltransferase [Anaerolineales bacterium]|nr:acylneuraminate cytidylyltransferase [Anaerolineales bacterium]MCX7754482.1 acylneuraminate cytidylyltransferase [Anaerolineales bacterium]MDW8277104.1 acylneuraminate cytidylyltransferase [Anaerolineales bacterium]